MTFFPIVKTEKKILATLDRIISMLLFINAHSVFEHVFQPTNRKIKSTFCSEIEINYDVITQNLTIKKF